MSENKKTNQIQPPEEIVLCGASAYNQKFYINENFKNLPDEIKNQLKVMCVLFCADAPVLQRRCPARPQKV